MLSRYLNKSSFYLVVLGVFGLCSIAYAAQNIWIQSDWSQGVGPSTSDQYSQSTDIDASVPGDLELAETTGWAFAGWSHRQTIAVANADVAQTDYQIKLVVPHANGMQADFDDLRFTNAAGTELDYWLQTKTDSVEAEVWLEVDDLVGGGDTIVYMYYGNDAAASGSDGEATFPFFDDFESGVIDPAKWIEIDIPADEIGVVGGWLVFERLTNGSWNKAVIANMSFARSDLSFESDYVWVVNNPAYDAIMYGWHDSGIGASYTNLVYAYYNPGSGGASTVGVHVYEDGISRAGEIGSWTVGTDYDIRVRMRESGGAYYEQSEDGGDTWLVSYTSVYSTESDVRPAWAFYSGTHKYDNVRVRKWMDAEPASSFGAVEMRYALSGTLTSNILDTHAEGSHWGNVVYESEGTGVVVVKVRTSHDASMSGAPDFSACPAVTSGDDVTGNGCAEDGHRFVQYHITMEGDGANTPIFEEFSIGFTPADVVANAGDDRTIAAGRTFTLDGTASAGEGLTYSWALVSGDGELADIQSATPTYSSGSDTPNQDVLIYLTARNDQGRVDTDEVTLHVVGLRTYLDVVEKIVGQVNGSAIIEELDSATGREKLDVGGNEVILPLNAGDYAFDTTSDRRLIIGVPGANGERGHAFLLDQPVGDMGHVDLEGSTGFKRVEGNQEGDLLGSFIASGDIDSDGVDEILMGSPGAASNGIATIYDLDFNIEAILIGTEDHPINSLFIGDDIALGHRFVAFGPGNPRFNFNLYLGSDESVASTPFAFLPALPEYLTGVVILSDDILDSPADPGENLELLSIGDLNGDGDSDLILASDADASFIYFDATSPDASASSIDFNVSAAGISGANLFGLRAVMGDVSGDGLVDIVVGAPDFDQQGKGAVFVVFGVPVWTGVVDLMTSANVLKLMGEAAGDRIGDDVLLADVNGDGIDEIYTVTASGSVVKFDLTASGASGGTSGCALNPYRAPTSRGLFGVALLAFFVLAAFLAKARFYAYTR